MGEEGLYVAKFHGKVMKLLNENVKITTIQIYVLDSSKIISEQNYHAYFIGNCKAAS